MFKKVKTHSKSNRTGGNIKKKFLIGMVTFLTIAAPASAEASYWKTIGSDADYGSGFSIVETSGRTGLKYYHSIGHARGMRVQIKGKPGTKITFSVLLKCWDYYDPYWGNGSKYDIEYESTDRSGWSFRATQNPYNVRLSMGNTSPPYLSAWDACRATVQAWTRDSGPLIVKVQKLMP